MRRFSLANFILAMIASPMASMPTRTRFAEDRDAHVLSIGTSPFSEMNIHLSEGACEKFGIKSPADEIDMESMDQNQLHDLFTNLYPVNKEEILEDGEEAFSIWAVTADEYAAAQISEEATTRTEIPA